MVWYAVGYGHIDFYKIMLRKNIAFENWSTFVAKLFERAPQNRFLTAVAKAAA
jgi:hypothetical protein